MEKPHLEVTKSEQSGLYGKCSSCDAYFTIVGPGLAKPEAVMKALQGKFDKHFQRVHMREDTGQAATRIVREVTEE
jgi:hypothetical protein